MNFIKDIFFCFISIVLYFKMSFIPVLAKLLQSSMSHHPSDNILICLFGAQKKFSNVVTVVLLVEAVIHVFRILC